MVKPVCGLVRCHFYNEKIYHSFWDIWTRIPGKDYINTLPHLNMDTHLSQRLVGSYFLFLPLWCPIHYLETLGDCRGLGVPLSSFISIVTSESCHHLTWVQFHPFPFYKRGDRLLYLNLVFYHSWKKVHPTFPPLFQHLQVGVWSLNPEGWWTDTL